MGACPAKGGKLLLFDARESWAPEADDTSGTPAYTNEPLDNQTYPYSLAGTTLTVTFSFGDVSYDKE